jgi:hypothetical protein
MWPLFWLLLAWCYRSLGCINFTWVSIAGAWCICHVAAAIEAVWYLTQPDGFAGMNVVAGNVAAPNLLVPQLTDGIRQLEQLRVDGLITEYEFEQKRRQFLDRM